MRKVILSSYVTLDGVMEAPNEWSFQFWNDELAKFKYDELFASDALLIGRVTYQGFAAAWPTMEGTGEFGERINGMPKYVASTTLTETEWNATLIAGDVAEAVAALKQQPGQDILVWGSADLARTLMQHDLIDEYRLMVYPVIVGKGKRLFKEGIGATTLTLVGTQTTDTSVVILTYRPAEKL